MTSTASADPLLIHMIWTRPIDDQLSAGRIKVALAVRAAARASGTIRETILEPAIGRGNRMASVRAAGAWLRSLFSATPLPAQCVLFAPPDAVDRVVAAIDPATSVVYLDGIRTFPLLRAIRRRFPSMRIVVDLDDLMSRRMGLLLQAGESLSAGYLSSRLPPLLQRIITGPFGRLLTRYEQVTFHRAEAAVTGLADAAILVSQADLADLPAGKRAARAAIPPPAAIRRDPAPLRPGPLRFIFVGTDTLTQNRLTIDYLIGLWRTFDIATPLAIFGHQARVPAPVPNVAFHGYIDDIDSAYDGASVLLSPSLIGGGIKTKTLEAFGLGAPVIGNAKTFEGMAMPDYPLVIDDEAALVRILRDPQAHRALFDAAAQAGGRYVRDRHGIDEFERRWRQVLRGGGRAGAPSPRTLVVIPTLNEAAHIEGVVGAILRDLSAADDVRVAVVDGGSGDGTRAIVARLAAADARIVLLDNPRRIQSAAVNLAVERLGGDRTILIRCDAHAGYPAHYIRRLIASLERSEADSVVVPMDSVGDSCAGRAIAWASDSLVGSGGSAHRGGRRSGFVDHGHHAAFRLEAFRAAQGYDDSFTHNEDAELDCRMRAGGARIFLDADIRIVYHARATFGGLWRQYRAYGRGRSRTMRRHPGSLRLRQIALPAFVTANGAALLIGLLWPAAWLLPLAYALLLAANAIGAAIRHRARCGLLSGVAALTMHVGWTSGFVDGLVRLRERPWRPPVPAGAVR